MLEYGYDGFGVILYGNLLWTWDSLLPARGHLAACLVLLIDFCNASRATTLAELEVLL